MSESKILIVEGADDAHAIRNLCYQHEVSICIDGDSYDGDIDILDAGGKDKVVSLIKTRLKLSDITHLGVVVDADDDAHAAFQSLANALGIHAAWSCADVQNDFTSDGWTGEAKLQIGDTVRVGTWIMPNNDSTGALEDFAARLVPQDDPQWAYAEEVLDRLDDPRFKPSHRGKAHMHTYLAWQDPPREPIGRSISSGVLKETSPLAKSFVAWVTELFDREIG